MKESIWDDIGRALDSIPMTPCKYEIENPALLNDPAAPPTVLVDGTDVVEGEGRLRQWLSEDVKPIVQKVLENQAARGAYRNLATGVTLLKRGDISDNPNVLLAVLWLDIDDSTWEISDASARYTATKIRDRLLEEFAQDPAEAVENVHGALSWLHSFITDRQQAIFAANRSSTAGDDLDGVRELLVEICDRALEVRQDEPDTQTPQQSDQPDENGYVESPSDLTAYRPFNDILLHYTGDLADLLKTSITAKRLSTILKEHPEVKWTRPLSKKTGKPRKNRKLIHLADWASLVDRLKRGADRELTPEEIKANAARIRQERQTQ